MKYLTAFTALVLYFIFSFASAFAGCKKEAGK